MSVKTLVLVLFLSALASAQTIMIGPLVDQSACVPDAGGLTKMCFAKDGVHVSLGGQPFGPPMPAQPATINIGTVTTLPAGSAATVFNSGTPQAAVLNFGIPSGQNGTDGLAATIQVGQVTSGPVAQVQNVGTPQQAVFNFVIPPGVGFAKGTQIGYTKTETCGGSTGTIKSGYTNTCTGTLTITNIQ